MESCKGLIVSQEAVLIIHPRAHRHRRCAELLKQLQARYKIVTEQSLFPGHTREHTRNLLRDFEGIVFTAGGDGTLHEALNGWADTGFPEGPLFCPLPLGTGNDFLYSLHPDLARIETYLTTPLTLRRTADLGKVTFQTDEGPGSCFFCVGATTGFSAVVTERRAQLAQKIPGRMSYLMALFVSFLSWKNRTLRVECETTPMESEIFMNFNAANVRHYGGGMISAPQADPFDGALDTVSMNLTLGQAARALPENFLGRFEKVKNVYQQRRSRPFTVDCQPACPVQADGELLGQTPMRVECFPGKLPLLMPDIGSISQHQPT